MALPFFTVGHSTRPITEFLTLLAESEIGLVADVRRIPGSRSHPQYGAAALAAALAEARVDYVHLSALGGRRPRQRGVSPEINGYWENDSFHNYADYALGAEFQEGLATLRELGRKRRSAVMCAEALWWKCHRRIITDYLMAADETVFHILGAGNVEAAQMTPAARVAPDGTVTYSLWGATAERR